VKEHPSAAYFGSAGKGLGFYHLDVPEEVSTKWLNFNNCGTITVKKGEISLSELERDFSAIFCKNRKWPWQMRELGPGAFLVRFPPWKNVKELSEFPAFDLEKEGVTVKIAVWTGDIQPIGELADVWVTVKGIPPKWCAWKTFGQLASLYGILMDVDWAALFKSFYGEVKLLIACKDFTLIPPQQIVEMNQQLYMLSLSVSVPGSDSGDGQDPDEPGQGGGNLVDDQANMETENATNLSPAPPQPPAAPAG
jgi:hypothetical protein